MVCRKQQNYTLLLQNSHLIQREDQKPLRYGKKKKNILGWHSANADACEKTP